MEIIKISIIIPVFNSEKYLDRCLQSILNSTFKAYEILLIDDGSTDLSGKICDEYSEKYDFIRIIHQKNRGQAAARNIGISKAYGEWICFIDSDDAIHPQMLEILYQAVSRYGTLTSICKAYESAEIQKFDISNTQTLKAASVRLNEESLIKLFNGNLEHYMSKYSYWCVWAKLIHRSIVQKYPFEEGRVYEDNAVVYKWLLESSEITFCDNCMYFYFVNQAGTTKQAYNLNRLDWLFAIRSQLDFYKTKKYKAMYKAVCSRYLKESVQEYENILNFLKDKHTASQLRKSTVVFWIKNNGDIELPREEKMDLLTRMFPRQIKILWKLKQRLVSGKN